jgi:glycosyltransferase involved in cell wall biosynthesis
VPKVSVTLITHNESANIDAALASVAWADERLVVDAESTDDTVARARHAGARVLVRPWPGYAAQKNFAASAAEHDWILSLDADERVSEPLGSEIRAVLTETPRHGGFRIPRVTWYLGHWIRSTDWYPDHQLRLYDRRLGSWSDRRVHESVHVRLGTVGLLSAEILHYAYRDLSDHLHRIDYYTTLAAEQMYAEGRRTSAFALLVHPPMALLRNLILRGGMRDGTVGLVVSTMNSYYVFLKLAKLWQRQRWLPSDTAPK